MSTSYSSEKKLERIYTVCSEQAIWLKRAGGVLVDGQRSALMIDRGRYSCRHSSMDRNMAIWVQICFDAALDNTSVLMLVLTNRKLRVN